MLNEYILGTDLTNFEKNLNSLSKSLNNNEDVNALAIKLFAFKILYKNTNLKRTFKIFSDKNR